MAEQDHLGTGDTYEAVITLIGSATLAWPFTAIAQEAGRTYRLGSLSPARRDAPFFDAFFDELRRNGFVEGQNLMNDAHGYGMRDEQFAEHAAELVKALVDVITAAGDVAVHAAQQATKTILPVQAIWSEQASWPHLPSPVAT